MRSLLAALLASTALVACGTPSDTGTDTPTETQATAQTESERLNEWFETKFEEELAFSPIQQTFLGRTTDLDKIDDFSIAAENAQLEWQRQSVEELKTNFDYNALTPEAQTSYDIWTYQLAQAEAALPFRSNGYVFEQMNAVHSFFPQLLISFHPATSYDELDAYVARIGASARAIDQLIVRSKANAETGVRPPHFAFTFVIDEATKIISGAPFDDSEADSDIWADFKTKVSTLADADTITAD